MTEEEFQEFIEDNNLLIADVFDSAIIGVARKFTSNSVLYDEDKCIEILMKGRATHTEAVEYFEFNIVGSYVGDDTPIFSRIIK